jgi:hypothetical protein
MQSTISYCKLLKTGPHCQGGHWDWTTPLQYQERVALVSGNHGNPLSTPSNFQDMTEAHLAMQFLIPKRVYKQPQPHANPSTEAL